MRKKLARFEKRKILVKANFVELARFKKVDIEKLMVCCLILAFLPQLKSRKGVLVFSLNPARLRMD